MVNISKVCVLGCLFLVGCGKQPTELQKAVIEKQLLGCLTSVTTQVGAEEENLFSAISSLSTKAGDMAEGSSIKWKIVETPTETITMAFSLPDTKYSCDYTKEENANTWGLQEVRRNNEVVFNLEDDLEAKAENEKIAEAKALAEARAEEEKRVAETKKWHERGYSNAAYKYYEKRQVDAMSGYYSGPTIAIICDPESPRVKYEGGSFSYGDKRDVSFVFVQEQEEVAKKFDLTSSGAIGKYTKDMFSGVYSDEGKTKEFIALLKSSTAVKIDGFTFNIDDITEVPCLK